MDASHTYRICFCGISIRFIFPGPVVLPEEMQQFLCADSGPVDAQYEIHLLTQPLSLPDAPFHTYRDTQIYRTGKGWLRVCTPLTTGDGLQVACLLCPDGRNRLYYPASMWDFYASPIRCLHLIGIETLLLERDAFLLHSSVVLHDPQGRRQIYCDLKDIQDASYPFREAMLADVDLVAACNINFNRPLLHLAKQAGKRIATDVHVLSDIYDGYNREFMECADILFLSDEGVGEDYGAFLWQLAHTYGCQIIVLGRGARGAAIYRRETDDIKELEAVKVERPVNTVGAGDALFSAFLHYYAKGLDALEALHRAQIFAAHKITVSGGANGFATEEQIECWRNER